MVYSQFALRDLSAPHLNCWLTFVAACRILCNRVLSDGELQNVHCLIQSFCEQMLDLYGAKAATPNLHLHLHLCDVVRDFGPIYGFWLYGFEWFNGILGSYKTNNRDIESQIMKKLLEGTISHNIQSSQDMLDDFSTLVKRSSSFKEPSSVRASSFDSSSLLDIRSLTTGDVAGNSGVVRAGIIK